MFFASNRLPIVAVLIVLASNPVANAAASELEGVYSGEDQQQKIEAAIEAVVAKMNFIKRPIARSRLKKTNPSYARIAIATTDGVLEVQFDDRKPIRMRGDGRPTEWTREDGEVFNVSAKEQDRTLVQIFEAEDGVRTNTFELGTDGRELLLHVRISSPQLPQPVEYTLTYTKAR